MAMTRSAARMVSRISPSMRHAGSDAQEQRVVLREDAFHFGRDQERALKTIDQGADRGRDRGVAPRPSENEGALGCVDARGNFRGSDASDGARTRARDEFESSFPGGDIAGERNVHGARARIEREIQGSIDGRSFHPSRWTLSPPARTFVQARGAGASWSRSRSWESARSPRASGRDRAAHWRRR